MGSDVVTMRAQA